MEKEIKEPEFKEKEAIVIQYLDTSMSNNLLSKYPDYSGFGFDYSQSSIWSPLVPRFTSISCLNPKSPDLNRRLSFEKISLSSSIKKKVCTFGLNLNAKIQKNKKKKKMLKCNNDSSEFQSPPSKKGWKKVLKMTSKQFKRKKDNHHRHPISRVTLSDFLQSQNF
ncbi:uncharacterized protein LOC110695120 [Chenopodium quinoa]|uniref:uncharacterized protein LOC110695120 n=1 Tax=Chenopodium quinoa TaxID=63459 RepID=UPI000B78D15A|nr:uncharacterized protein LOC110695120 [Chenopodium quinoa]